MKQQTASAVISRTINYKGNRIDLGGHRFFSKSDRVMQWWTNILPVQGKPARDDILLRRDTSLLSGNDPRILYGWDWNISAMKVTNYGANPIRTLRNLQ